MLVFVHFLLFQSFNPIMPKPKTFSAADYRDGLCSSREFYRQFIDQTVIDIVLAGIGERDIKKSRDRYFNDIGMRQWDLVAAAVRRYLRKKIESVGAYASNALLICIQKEAAEQIRSGR